VNNKIRLFNATKLMREMRGLLQAIILFILAGLAEIGGGYLVWLWLREGLSYWYGVIGSLILILYGVIPTFQAFPSFGRVYAAYGGVFIILAVLWGWGIDKKTPDVYDWIGSIICIIGVSIMLWAPRT
jgi:small multidrug resistance family-3 protein